MRKVLPLARILVSLLLFESITGCYFFRKRTPGGTESTTSGVVGESLGLRAGGVDDAALAEVHGISTSYAPAGIRPDPDVVVRNLLLEYRDQGSTVAREIGRVESYRLLLGGANQDFTITPQNTYDATSLLAKLKVAEEVCTGLVAPSEDQHPGWDTILPADPSDTGTNILFLAQRLMGVPSSAIEADTISSLESIIATATEDDGSYSLDSYIPVCATLILDVNSLLL
ncbi:hypothetical protein [Pseudobacteriovorax antillogorgiicola]|uniref:Uncharacterized protein n=1 Tax=Pseudobacteriovorax antillogorgiicola TaxID=1513793 RepID=A0A1Y6CBH4_9BACT|nr:hypothetical protein [Pseudobacteriovorax antillogorgiicola]TCS48607.1 hypothetical protein EDD56_11729 [Pseudobacteriovorax antillogorgiicola]SMF55521.1 hypothetical protein SAMN06296036_117130 [Pseudobacteriovorax antillogorgiicola]